VNTREGEAALPSEVSAAVRSAFPNAALNECTLLRRGDRNAVHRCIIRDESGTRRLVAKRIERDAVRGLTDWASHAFLSTRPDVTAFVPRFAGGDTERRVFFMEEAPSARSLEEVFSSLQDGDVSEVLAAHARSLALLHVATFGALDAFDRERRALGVDREGDWTLELVRWRRNVPTALRWIGAPSRGRRLDVDSAIEAIASSFGRPGPYLTFTHGDIAPSNVLVGDDGTWLVDFEYGAFRHALYDPTSWHILYPLSEEAVMAFGAAYRGALERGIPAAGDPTLFAREWARIAAYRALALLSWLPIEAREWDRAWVDAWSVRNAARTTLRRLGALSHNDPALDPLSEASSVAYEFFCREWGEVESELPRWR
jgi:hypothetical protein